jgi:hypothetical protein
MTPTPEAIAALARAIASTRHYIRSIRIGDGPVVEYSFEPERTEAEAILAALSLADLRAIAPGEERPCDGCDATKAECDAHWGACCPDCLHPTRTLDAAWARAVAALPEGWGLSVEGSGDWYDAHALNRHDATDFVYEAGPTPALALHALADELERRKP